MKIKKKTGATLKKKVPTKPVGVEKSKVTLPDAPSEPLVSLGDFSILLYGEKKIGKTTLASQFEGAFFCMFEPGAKALSVYQRSVKTWQEFKDYIRLLEDDSRFRTIVVDPVDLAYKMCLKHVCKREVMKHPSDEGWGKGWELVRDEFTTEINRLLDMGKGVILISHAVDKEIKTRVGDSYNKIVATMAGQAREILEGVVDVWAYYAYEGKKRTLVIEGDDHIGAGHRLSKHFRYPDGTAVREIPMGSSPEEAYDNFVKAFNNKLQPMVVAKKKLKLKRRD